MNKEQAIKHKEVIKWWLDNSDKGVWECDPEDNKWVLVYTPFFFEQSKYVQNDEYSKLRKAQADGKIIQVHHNDEDGWIDCKPKSFDRYAYRIKPDDPVFNVDDWGTVQHEDGVFLFRIIKVRDNRLYYGKSITAYVFANNAKLWKPAEGEWVVVWQGNWVENYQVKRYYTAITYDNIAPLKFIQTLKDK